MLPNPEDCYRVCGYVSYVDPKIKAHTQSTRDVFLFHNLSEPGVVFYNISQTWVGLQGLVYLQKVELIYANCFPLSVNFLQKKCLHNVKNGLISCNYTMVNDGKILIWFIWKIISDRVIHVLITLSLHIFAFFSP